MPTLHLHTYPDTCGLWFSFHIDKEGMFLFVAGTELALLWPGVQS